MIKIREVEEVEAITKSTRSAVSFDLGYDVISPLVNRYAVYAAIQ